MRQTLIEMGWPHPPSPIQTEVGMVNDTIIARKIKSMYLRFYFLLFREAQPQFRFYWTPMVQNIWPTAAPRTTRQFTMNQNDPYSQAPFRGYTKPF